MSSDGKVLEEGREEPSHETPQAITITIMDPSALETTTLDPTLVTSMQSQDTDQGMSTLLVMPREGHRTKDILQTVTETHMGTQELPVISSISNTEEESQQSTIQVMSKSQDDGEGEGILASVGEAADEEEGDEGDDLGDPLSQHCLICNLEMATTESEKPIPVFKSQTSTTHRKMAVFLGTLVGQKLTSRKAHSDIICRRCFNLLDKVDALEVEIRDTKEEIITKFQETVTAYGGRARRRKPATAKKSDYVFPKVEPEEDILGLEMDENFEPRMEDLLEEEQDHREDRTIQDEEWEPEFKRPKIKREPVEPDPNGPPKRKRGRPRKDASKPKGDVGVVTIGLVDNSPASKCPEGAAHGAVTVFDPSEGTRLRRRRPASYRPCDLCGVIPFGDIERHVAEYHPEALVRACALCDMRFRTFRQLGGHVLRVHGPSFLCPACSECFTDAGAFTAHLNGAHAEIPTAFMCVVCRHSFLNVGDYCSHMLTHQAEVSLQAANKQDEGGAASLADALSGSSVQDDSNECTHCQKKFKSKMAMKRHMQRSHGEKPMFKCKICYLKFQSNDSLLDHTETHTTGAIQCPLCPQQFAKFHHLRSHCNNTHHDTVTFRCQHCSHIAKSINALFTHVLVRHPDQLGLARNIRCTKCGEKFHSGRELAQHKSSRHAELVKCTYCGKQMSKYLLAAHVNEKHTKQHKSECSYCGESFFNPGKLSEHVKRHHLREHYSRFVCQTCGKAYITRNELQRHTATHTNERRYKCEFCGRAYFKAGDLTYHRRTHTGERPHACNSCGAAFSRPSELTTHLARTHGLHHRTRRYFRSALPDSLNAATEAILGESGNQNLDVQVVTGGGEEGAQLITEVGEDGHVVHVVQSEASLQMVQALSQELDKEQQHDVANDQGDMQVIYVELVE
ncbi:zinc finger protein 287-like isoform X4 [Penaeus monodon]|uniref:zinc finger protein 287-like isoform X4 n=1 Tax=Penaeus monodon TaxID=6687 RepID=UPI0018A7CF5C|nr:zinc finger protein 287-like isoform X4 [Penaeus monodon]